MTNSSGKMFVAEIDMDDPENQNPKQELEETENIKVHILDLNENLLD